VPRVLVTCRSQQLAVEGEGDENVRLYYYITDDIQIQFRGDEFCLVTGLRFGVKNLADYNDPELHIPFRIRVLPSCYDGDHIIGYAVLEIIQDDVFDRLHDEDAVSLCCLGILQLVLLGVEAKRRIPDWMLRVAAWKKRGSLWEAWFMIFFIENCLLQRLTPDETKARSNWWISSRAYFDGGIGQAERLPRHLNGKIYMKFPQNCIDNLRNKKEKLKNKKE
nr:phospholipase-like protein [Tanacetum cinerariifolium]